MQRELIKFFGPTEYAIKNLESGEIYCQHYSAYNDPFEFWSNLYDGIPDAAKEPERFLAAKRAWGCEWMSPEDEDLIAYFDECKGYQPPFKKLRDEMRIACFGTQLDNLLMWSHYGDGLRGFCVVFDEDEIVGADRKVFAVDVAYLEAPPVADAFVYGVAKDQIWYHEMAIEESETRSEHLGETEPLLPEYEQALVDAYGLSEEILQIVFAAKPSEWKYERERRLLVQTDRSDTSPIFRHYPREAIKEVILGERMPYDYRSNILAILKRYYAGVPVKTARRAQGIYTLAID